MDFGSWLLSHTLLVIFIVAGFIGQVAIYFYRTAQNDKKIDKQSEDIKEMGEAFFHALERLEDRIDKRFVEVNQRMGETNQRIDGLRSEMNQRLSEVQAEISDVRSEIGDVRSEMRQLNQNHIEHLNRHHG